MTREEAMRRLDGMKSLYPYENNPHKEAIDMAIEALSEPSIIRCKDCKWHGMDKCPMWGGYTTEDYMWCYDGERREP